MTQPARRWQPGDGIFRNATFARQFAEGPKGSKSSPWRYEPVAGKGPHAI